MYISKKFRKSFHPSPPFRMIEYVLRYQNPIMDSSMEAAKINISNYGSYSLTYSFSYKLREVDELSNKCDLFDGHIP